MVHCTGHGHRIVTKHKGNTCPPVDSPVWLWVRDLQIHCSRALGKGPQPAEGVAAGPPGSLVLGDLRCRWGEGHTASQPRSWVPARPASFWGAAGDKTHLTRFVFCFARCIRHPISHHYLREVGSLGHESHAGSVRALSRAADPSVRQGQPVPRRPACGKALQRWGPADTQRDQEQALCLARSLLSFVKWKLSWPFLNLKTHSGKSRRRRPCILEGSASVLQSRTGFSVVLAESPRDRHPEEA